MKYVAISFSLLAFCLTPAVSAQQADRSAPVVSIKVERSVKSVTYRAKGGQTPIGFEGTALLPRAVGKAKVENKQGVTHVQAEFSKLESATRFGAPYLTYVLWAITPEGRANNLGEVMLNGDKAKVNVSTRLLSFGLILTAEPYFAVTLPSEVVVLENTVVPGTVGKIETIDAKYELLQRGHYETARLEQFSIDPKVPLELYQARNAARIARFIQADRYAPESWAKAQTALQNAESYQSRKGNNRKPVMMTARDAAQTFEDARVITVKRVEEERLAQERQAAAEREARAKAEADLEARRRAEADARRKDEEEARRRAELERQAEAARRERAEAEKLKAELAAAQESQRRAEAEAAKARAQAEEEQARRVAEEAKLKEEEARRQAEQSRLAAEQAAREKAELRVKLLQQFNSILETRDTDRGLVVNMGDVLFDTGRFTLRAEAREKLARLAGIVLNYPGLKLESEGHTDNVGGEAFNQRLSEQRSNAVREYLVSQGIVAENITAVGKGFSMPVADNKTASGRQQNRRVELIVSGEVIGAKIGSEKP